MNNRVVANGTPLADRFDNVARVLRRAGYDPTLFGYTDIGIDPLVADGPADPRLDSYDGVLPGFSVGFRLPEDQSPWHRVAHLARLRRARALGRRAARRARPPRGALPLGVPHGPVPRVARPPAGGLVRARLVPAAALALRRGGGVRRLYDPADVGATDRAGRGRPSAAPTRCSASRWRAHRPTRRGCARCARSTSAWSPRWTPSWAGSSRRSSGARGVGRHDRGRRSRPRRAAGRPRAHREARLLRGELPHALHRPRPPPPRGARPRRGGLHRERRRPADASVCSSARPSRPGRRPAAHLVPRGHDAAVVARRGALGVGLALRLHRLATSRTGRTDRRWSARTSRSSAPRRTPTSSSATASWRCFDLGHGSDVADRDRRTPPSCSPSPRRSPGGARSTSIATYPRCCSRRSGSDGGPRSSPRPWRRARGAAGRAARRSPRRR